MDRNYEVKDKTDGHYNLLFKLCFFLFTDEMREKFKSYVNTLATIKMDDVSEILLQNVFDIIFNT